MFWPIPIGVHSPLGRRLVALSFFRLGVLAVFLVVTQKYYLGELGGLSSKVAIATIALAFSTTAVYSLALRRERWLERMAHAQLITDQLTWTAIVYISGGVTSGATSLYGLTCLSGAILLGTAGALSAAAAGAGCYLGLCWAFASGWLGPPADQSPDAYLVRGTEMVYPAFSAVMAIAVVTLLASYLAERLRAFGRQLDDATRRALDAERLAGLGRLAAGLAHEIRNPLGSIRGSIELLRTGRALSDEDKRLCAIVEQETLRLNQLVTDMIDLSRPRDPALHEVDLAQVVASVVELAKRSARGSEVTVRYEGPASLKIVADAGQMHQVLWNLVRNAMQVSAAGGRVAVELDNSEGGASLRVVDGGPGIAPGERERMFEAFFTTRKHGVGIGLAVVKQIVEGHGFAIEVDSGPGRGTTFAVRIPKALVIAALLAGCGAAPAVTVDDLSPASGWVGRTQAPSAGASAGASEPAPLARSSEPAPLPPIDISEKGVHTGKGAETGSGPAAVGSEIYRNTYYYFPEESTAPESGPTRTLYDAQCKPLRTVSEDFHDRLCVQGSGRLASGQTVSFAKRGCACAAVCPRTGHKICYQLLAKDKFPFGRGATGKAITPLRTVAVDSGAVPLGTVIYVPEMDGLRDLDGRPHDGCFIAQDRGSRVKGKQIDFFVGSAATADAWNRAVPSNRGVHAVLGANRCQFLERWSLERWSLGRWSLGR